MTRMMLPTHLSFWEKLDILSICTYNIITHLRGVKGNVRPCKSAIDCWHNLFTDKLLELIV